MTKPENMLDELIAPQLAELDPTHTQARPDVFRATVRKTICGWDVEKIDETIAFLTRLRDSMRPRA